MDRVLIDQTVDMVPSLTHHLEEKAILSFLYDRRFEEQIRESEFIDDFTQRLEQEIEGTNPDGE